MRTATLAPLWWLLILWGLCGAQAQHSRLRRPEPLTEGEGELETPQMSALLGRLHGFYTVYGRGRKRQENFSAEEPFFTVCKRDRKRQQPTLDESSDMLKGLREFYTATGRGRFGKRQRPMTDGSVSYKIPAFSKLEKPLWKNLATI